MNYIKASLCGLLAALICLICLICLNCLNCLAAETRSTTQLINIGTVALPPDQPSSRTQPFFTKSLSLPALCASAAECQLLTVRWVAMDGSTGDLSQDSINVFDLSSSGLAASVRFPERQSDQPQAGQSTNLEFGLLKVADDVAAGSVDASKPLFKRIVDKRDSTGVLLATEEITFNLQGNIVASSCLLTTKALTLRLPGVTSTEIGATAVGNRVEGKVGTSTLQVVCSGVESMSLQFSSASVMSDPTLLRAALPDGGSSGLAFKMFYQQAGEHAVHWDNSHAVEVLNPKNVSLPLSAYYVKESNAVNAGSISATGIFTLYYR